MERKTIEDLCKYIKKLDRGSGAKSVDVARALSLSRSTVSLLLSKLAKLGFCKKHRYGRVVLTEKGNRVAREMEFKHRVLESFLATIGTTRKEIHGEACRIEHAISNRTARLLYLYLGRPKIDPHGKPIECV